MADTIAFLEPHWTLELSLWVRIACAGLCLLSLYFGAQTTSCYRRYFDNDDPVVELPAMFLLPWLGACDILNAAVGLAQLLLASDGSAPTGYMSVVWRAGLVAQICYMLLHIMLAVHIMSIAGVVSRKFDSAVSCYYGPAAGTLAFMATYRVIPTLSFYPFAYLTVLPAATLALVIAAAARASKAARVAGGRITVRIGEDEDVDANVSLDDYSAFAKTTAALFLLWCLPWMIWSHTPSLPQWAVVLAIAPLRARGVHSFVLTRTSPALSMQVVEEEDDEDKDTSTHSHQD